MALEKELKFENIDHEKLREILRREKASYVGRWFEENIVFDTSERELKRRGILLRLRKKGAISVLTVKTPPEEECPSHIKVFQEHETEIADFDALANCFVALGYSPAFSYEKIREKWALAGCVVCLDMLPFGMYVEIEGDEKAIALCSQRLALQQEDATIETYHALNLRVQMENGASANESFVFEDEHKRILLAELVS